jgi:hypothetical protein
MPAHGIAAVPAGLRSQFLEGLTPFERRTILAATTKRQFAARSVITNQDHPASHFYVLTKGFARYFVVTKEGKKLLLQWLGPGDLVGGRTALPHNSLPGFSISPLAGKCPLNRIRLPQLASRFLCRLSLLHPAPSHGRSSDHFGAHHWPGGPRRCRNPDNQRGIGQRR